MTGELRSTKKRKQEAQSSKLAAVSPPPISFPSDQARRPALPRRRRGDKGSPDASGSLPTRPLHPALPLRLPLSPPDPLTSLPQHLRRRPPSSTQPPIASHLAGVSRSILILAYIVYIDPFELNIATTWIGPVFLVFAPLAVVINHLLQSLPSAISFDLLPFVHPGVHEPSTRPHNGGVQEPDATFDDCYYPEGACYHVMETVDDQE
ncbi:uncharacterized protein LOC119361241 [Triticum dicoccoides]|uniref:uncharacterized protein LOC119361241 n=1 Tax=Triticum dicoccoides TaxID=85692 RepID=UPI00188E66DA|nr:uncharacterized protein LOC119361241 [Triticum dicoccoides]